MFLKTIYWEEKTSSQRKEVSEPIAFLDVQVNHITKEVGHINNKVLSKTVQRYEVFLVSQAVSVSFFLFLLQI